MRNRPSSWIIPRGPPAGRFAAPLIRLREEGVEGCPPSPGLRNALKVTLIRMRHGAVQTVIGEQLGMSQPTVSRAVRALTDTIIRTLKDMPLTAEEVPENRNFRAGRQPLLCWSWRRRRELWSW